MGLESQFGCRAGRHRFDTWLGYNLGYNIEIRDFVFATSFLNLATAV